jgi:hypothetical protein
LPNVVVTMSTRPATPQCSGVPRPVLAHETGRVRVVDEHERPVLVREIADLGEGRDGAVHREDAVGHDHAEARGRGLLQLRFEVRHVRVRVDEALGLAQAHAVDDRRVVQLIREDRVVGTEQRLEDAAVRVEARDVEDRRLHPEERGDAPLQLLVQRLGAADEAHAGQPVAPLVERLVRGLQERLVAGEAEVVVRAEVENGSARPSTRISGPWWPRIGHSSL